MIVALEMVGADMKHFKPTLILVFLLGQAWAHSGSCQEPEQGIWSDAFDLPYLDDRPTVFTEYDGYLVVGGPFYRGNGFSLPHVARLIDGAWQPMGILPCDVRAFCVFQGTLYAAGSFCTTNGSWFVLAQWNGSDWIPVSTPPYVEGESLRVFNGALIVGGSTVARWDGSEWSSLGETTPMNSVTCLAEYKGDLMAAGESKLQAGHWVICRWDGSTWNVLEGDFRYLSSLASIGNTLFAGGMSDFARYDGTTWEWNPDGFLWGFPAVKAFNVFGNDLWMVGMFVFNNGNGPSQAARWNGSTWSPLGSELNYYVNGFITIGSDTLALAAVPNGAGEVLRWNGTNWEPYLRHPARFNGVSPQSGIGNLVQWNGGVVAGGNFTQAGAALANNIAFWDGSDWHALGAGLPSYVTALTTFHGMVAAASVHSNVAAVALWDGQDWSDTGLPFGSSVEALGTFHDSLLAGIRMPAESNPPGVLARWDGGTWNIMSSVNGDDVFTFAEFNGDLYVGGDFAAIDGVPSTEGLARWDGATWQSVGAVIRPGVDEPLIPGKVHVLKVWNGELIAAGMFTQVGSLSVNGIAAFDGTAWHTVAGGIPDTEIPENLLDVTDLAVLGTDLLVTGRHKIYDDNDWFYRLSGGEWWPMGEPFDRSPYTLCVESRGSLYAGGSFTKLGGNSSFRFAHWSDPMVAVGLLDLRAGPSAEGVRIEWGSTEPAAFEVFGEDSHGVRNRLGAALTAGEARYTFVDERPAIGLNTYWIAEIARDGAMVWHGPVSTVFAPTALKLLTALSPFRESTSIRFVNPSPSQVHLSVFSIDGRRIATPFSALLPEGTQELQWDGKDILGRKVPSGIYVLQLATRASTLHQRVVKIH